MVVGQCLLCAHGEDGMVHLALGFGEGGVVEMMVVGVGRIMELDESLSGEQGVIHLLRPSQASVQPLISCRQQNRH